MVSQLPVAEEALMREQQSRKLLKSISGAVIWVVKDANLVVVLAVFIAVCLLALNVNVITPHDKLVVASFTAYP
jgi:hypothetical protein